MRTTPSHPEICEYSEKMAHLRDVDPDGYGACKEMIDAKFGPAMEKAYPGPLADGLEKVGTSLGLTRGDLQLMQLRGATAAADKATIAALTTDEQKVVGAMFVGDDDAAHDFLRQRRGA